MHDRREDILNQEHRKFVQSHGIASIYPEDFSAAYKDAAINAMDEYMKETCLQLLEYMAVNGFLCCKERGESCFQASSSFEYLTKEQLFENFL